MPQVRIPSRAHTQLLLRTCFNHNNIISSNPRGEIDIRNASGSSQCDQSCPNILKDRRGLLTHLQQVHHKEVVTPITQPVQKLFGISICLKCELHYSKTSIANVFLCIITGPSSSSKLTLKPISPSLLIAMRSVVASRHYLTSEIFLTVPNRGACMIYTATFIDFSLLHTDVFVGRCDMLFVVYVID